MTRVTVSRASEVHQGSIEHRTLAKPPAQSAEARAEPPARQGQLTFLAAQGSRARGRAAEPRAAARDDGETMKLMMVLLPAGLLLMPLGVARGHRTRPDGAQASRTADSNSVLNRLSARALRSCSSASIKQFIR